MAVNSSREAWRITGGVFDNYTRRILEKLRSQDHFDELESALALGKEANVFTTLADEPTVVKVYRLENRDFNQMLRYLIQDPRYMHIKRGKREIVFSWCQREYRNLLLAREAIPVPKPIAHRKNVLVMEQIGKPDPAPKLKDLRPKEPEIFFNKIIDYMKKLWDIQLVHGDLSDFNILNNKEQPVFIDFSQCSRIDAPNAEELWERDVKNIITAARRCEYELTEEDFTRNKSKD